MSQSGHDYILFTNGYEFQIIQDPTSENHFPLIQ